MKIILKWFFGILFILAGIGSFSSNNSASGVIFILIGIVMIPPVLQFMEESWNMRFSSAAKYCFVIGGMILAGALMHHDQKQSTVNTSTTDNTIEVTAQPADEPEYVKIGEVLSTNPFDVRVNKVSIVEEINTGNMYSDLQSDANSKFLIVNVTFKNTDTESRMILEGSVFIQYRGTEYEYDKSETILAEGWGTFLDQLNPLTSKTTRLVYRIPSEISGPAYYEPGRNYSSKRIFLGNL